MVEKIKSLVPEFLERQRNRQDYPLYYFDNDSFAFVEIDVEYYLRFHSVSAARYYYFMKDSTWNTDCPVDEILISSMDDIISVLFKTVQDSEEW